MLTDQIKALLRLPYVPLRVKVDVLTYLQVYFNRLLLLPLVVSSGFWPVYHLGILGVCVGVIVTASYAAGVWVGVRARKGDAAGSYSPVAHRHLGYSILYRMNVLSSAYVTVRSLGQYSLSLKPDHPASQVEGARGVAGGEASKEMVAALVRASILSSVFITGAVWGYWNGIPWVAAGDRGARHRRQPVGHGPRPGLPCAARLERGAAWATRSSSGWRSPSPGPASGETTPSRAEGTRPAPLSRAGGSALSRRGRRSRSRASPTGCWSPRCCCSPTRVALPLLLVISLAAAMCGVGVAALLAAESPAGAGTTVVLNGSLLNAGAAGGAALGGVLIALGGYGALGLGLPLFAFAAAVLAWWPAARSGSGRLPV